MNRGLLALYPRAWRERYGAEVTSLADELISAGETTPLRAALGLIGGAALERWRVLTSRAVLVPVVAVLTAVGALALAESRLLPRPYFATQPAGWLLPIAEVAWLMTEAVEFWRARQSRYWRERAATTGQRRFWIAAGLAVIATSILLHLAPLAYPGAAIRPGTIAFITGLVTLVAGIGLRRWSFTALRGRYVTCSIAVGSDQPMIASGPYRLLRHPGPVGLLLICLGCGLAAGNWAGLAAEALLPLAFIVCLIHAQERALLTTLGGRYGRYASGRRRLVPLVW
jgi:protein-S-isoprenylcysteine O-methyltransferase Ste14